MDFLADIAVEIVTALAVAGILAALTWLVSRLFRRRNSPVPEKQSPTPGEPPTPALPGAENGPDGQSGLLRVLVALPRPLLTLLREQGGVGVPAAGWDAATNCSRVVPLRVKWKVDAIEAVLQAAGDSLQARFLPHATEAALRSALAGREYDLLIVDTHGDADGTLCFEGPHGETHPLSPTDLGRILAGSGMQLVILSACYSAAAGSALRRAGVPAVVGMADTIAEDAARAYLSAFLTRLAQGDPLEKAHARARDALQTRWSRQAGEATLPRLFARKPGLALKTRSLIPGGQAPHPDEREKEYFSVPASSHPDEREKGRFSVPAPSHPDEREKGRFSVPALSHQLRGRELDQVFVQCALLDVPLPERVSPLVALLGTGGVGKTALSLAVARWCWERRLFPGGVRFVPLANLRTAEGETLAERLLFELGLAPPQELEGIDVYPAQVDALRAALAGQPRLLLLDNFETAAVRPGNVALLADLRRRCPNLHIALTCRHAALGLAGVSVYQLRPLAEDPAVTLFYDRARDVGAGLDPDDWSVVDEICALLDRVPLHIRLVASHARAQAPAAILEGLRDAERRHHLTAARLPGQAERHQSRELSLRYTYDMLSAGGQRAWAIFATVFAGEPDRDAMRAVIDDDARAERAIDELLDWLLLERSGARHRMAESVRAFGRARLADLGLEKAALRARHAAHYADVARETFTMEKYQRGEWAAGEAACGADVFAAADWAATELERIAGAPVDALLARWDELEPGERGGGVLPVGELAYVLTEYVYYRRPAGGYRWLAAGLAAYRMSGAEEARSRQSLLCNQFGLIHDARGAYGEALAWYEKSVAIKEELGDRAGLATSYNNIGEVNRVRGAYAEALAWYEKSVAIQEELGDRAGLATSYNNIGGVNQARGAYAEALAWYEKSVAIKEELGDRAGLATTLHNVGHVALAGDDLRRALALFTRSRDIYAAIGLEKDVAEEEEMMAEVERRM